MDILNYINGERIKPNVKEYFGVINPATGQLIAQTPFCNAADEDTPGACCISGMSIVWMRRSSW
ncbi:MAG TPA: hypothetical protein VGA72_13430 [Anaerolineales bacterium]